MIVRMKEIWSDQDEVNGLVNSIFDDPPGTKKWWALLPTKLAKEKNMKVGSLGRTTKV